MYVYVYIGIHIFDVKCLSKLITDWSDISQLVNDWLDITLLVTDWSDITQLVTDWSDITLCFCVFSPICSSQLWLAMPAVSRVKVAL